MTNEAGGPREEEVQVESVVAAELDAAEDRHVVIASHHPSFSLTNDYAPEGAELHDSLSERELQTLKKIASGKKLSQIAEELMISPKTVSVYRARVLEKLHLANNAELTVYAIRNGIV